MTEYRGGADSGENGPGGGTGMSLYPLKPHTGVGAPPAQRSKGSLLLLIDFLGTEHFLAHYEYSISNC